MAGITPGTGATIGAVTAEAQAIAALCWLNQRENLPSANTTGRDGVNATFDIDLLVFSGNYSIPANQTINGSGQLIIVAESYVNGGAFVPGSDGTFKSQTIEAYVLETLMYLQVLELQPSKNPNNRNFVTGNYSADARAYTGTFSIPITLIIEADGSSKFVAVEYLLT